MKVFQRTRTVLEQNPVMAAGIFLLSISAILFLTGYINQNIRGEAFYDFQYADRYPWDLSWKVFFFNRVLSRLMHGVFVTFLYKIFGYNPPAIYLSALFLQISSAVFISLAIKNFINDWWNAFIVTCTLALLPLGMQNALVLKEIHHALAWLLFWIAVWFFSKWAANRSLFSLSGMTIAFILAVLSYEVVIALLPVSVLLALPILKGTKDFIKNIGLTIFVSCLAAAVVIVVDGIKMSGRLGELLFASSSAGFDSLTRIFQYLLHLPSAVWFDGLFGEFYMPGTLVSFFSKVIIALSLSIALMGAMASIGKARQFGKFTFANFQDKRLVCFLSGIYLGIFAYVPYGLLNIDRNVDSLQGVSVGLILVALGAVFSLAQIGRQNLSKALIGLICLFWIAIGGINYVVAQQEGRADDIRLSNFIFSIKQFVPYVKENTTFIFVEAGFSRTGDIGLMNMLYGRKNLRCIHLFDFDREETYMRLSNLLVEDTGREYDPDFIILTFDETGRVSLIASITPEAYPNLPITWIVNMPILLNHSRIMDSIEGTTPSTQLYTYMTEHFSSGR
jgi:hypothetical protein